MDSASPWFYEWSKTVCRSLPKDELWHIILQLGHLREKKKRKRGRETKEEKKEGTGGGRKGGREWHCDFMWSVFSLRVFFFPSWTFIWLFHLTKTSSHIVKFCYKSVAPWPAAQRSRDQLETSIIVHGVRILIIKLVFLLDLKLWVYLLSWQWKINHPQLTFILNKNVSIIHHWHYGEP